MSDSAQEFPVYARARRAHRVAKARVLDGLPLTWEDVDTAPSWLAIGEPDARERLCAHVGGWWLMAALKACIDGKRLVKVRDLLGEELLARLHGPADERSAALLDQAPRPMLPLEKDISAYLLACGRGLLSWDLPSRLKALVPEHLGWHVKELDYAVFDNHDVWARYALEMAQQENLPSSPPSLPSSPSPSPPPPLDSKPKASE
ncbi:MAG: hypothetical protein LBE78_01875 [Burkholderiaceae bacterium]|jgi:hypothetical protein|nr:hypothetical protein [Burkholderiaceae bacterium]